MSDHSSDAARRAAEAKREEDKLVEAGGGWARGTRVAVTPEMRLDSAPDEPAVYQAPSEAPTDSTSSSASEDSAASASEEGSQ